MVIPAQTLRGQGRYRDGSAVIGSAEKRGKLICRASCESHGVEIGGGREEEVEGWARIASIDYEARRASLMADSDIYRVNGRRPSIFPRDDLTYPL